MANRSFKMRKRGGRKLILAPDGTNTWGPPRRRIDNAMVKAIAERSGGASC